MRQTAWVIEAPVSRRLAEEGLRSEDAPCHAGQPRVRLYDCGGGAHAKSEFDSFPIEWFRGLTRIMSYPPAADRYAAAGIPTLAYHDAWTTWASSGATHVAEYLAWVKRDKEHGYLGQFMDDVNFAGGNIAGTPAQYANLIEAVRAALGSGGVIEINAQMWNLKSMLGNPDVQRALKYVNVVTKEFNVDPSSGISSSSKYGEYLEYVDGLRAKGIGITNTGDSSYNSEANKEYSLASYLLVNTGLDFIGFSHQSPSSAYPALKGMNLGEQTQARTQSSSGLWTRIFTHGEAIVAPPGTSGSVTLPRPMTRIGASSDKTGKMQVSPHGAAGTTETYYGYVYDNAGNYDSTCQVQLRITGTHP